jgi:hypothetical protein
MNVTVFLPKLVRDSPAGGRINKRGDKKCGCLKVKLGLKP